MNTDEQISPRRQAALNGLAIVGFIALVAAGIWLAVYSTRFVPSVVNGIGAAAVYLGSVFTPTDETSLTVLPTPTNPTGPTTLTFGDGPVLDTVVTTPDVTPTRPVVTPTPATVGGDRTTNTYQIAGATSTRPLSGHPDLTSSIVSIGYLATSSAESFVASSTVPYNHRPAVKFTIKNIGTNATGRWRFNASIPTSSSYIYYSPFQQSLNPGESIEYTLGFDQAIPGTNKTISISANFDRVVVESTYENNGASAKLTILGS